MRVIGWDMQLCRDCEDKLAYLDEIPWQALFPAEINGREPSFDRAEALFEYSGTARAAVLSLKYRRGVRFAEYAAKRLPEKLAADGGDEADIITSVPMHVIKKRKRGYDQAEVFAKALSREMGIEYIPDLLGHRRSGHSQHELKSSERYEAAENAYYIRSDISLAGKSVILCDDIFTTGATADTCSGLLKQMGAERVCVAAICRTMAERDRTDEHDGDNEPDGDGGTQYDT